MREVVLRLDRLEVTRFDPRTLIASIRIAYAKDNQQEQFEMQHDLTTKSEAVTEQIVRELKKRGSIDIDDDDVLNTLYVKKFINEDKAEKRMLLFFAKLYERCRVIAREKNHTRYMQLLDEIQHLSVVI